MDKILFLLPFSCEVTTINFCTLKKSAYSRSIIVLQCQGIDETVRALGEAFSENNDAPPAAAPAVNYAQHLDCDENDLRAIAEACNQDGDAEREENEFEHAIELYTNGIGMQCNDEQLNARMYGNRAAVHFIMGNYDAALSDARSAREFQPNHVEAFEIGASAYIELGSNKEAVTWCDDGLAIDHRNKKLRELKSKSLRLQAVQPGIDDDTLRGIADGYNKDGDAELRKNEFNNAIDFYTEGIQVNCKDDHVNALLYTNRATVHFLVGNYDDALSDAKCARKFRPMFLKAIVKGASACFELALFEETMHWCDDGLAIEKGEMSLLELRERSLIELRELRKEERSTNVPVSQSQPLGFKDWSLQTLTGLSAAVEEVIEQPTFIEMHRVLYNVNRFKKAARVFLSSNNHDTADHESGGGDHGAVYTSIPGTKGRKLIKDFFKLELSLNQNLGWKAGEGHAYHNLGSACIMDGDFKQALEYHKQHLTIASERGDRRGEGMAYFSLGCVYFNLGDIDQAIDCLKLALSISKEVGERARVFEVEARDILGSAYLAQDKYEEAQKHFEQNLQIASQERDRVQEGRACGNLGIVYFYQGEWHKAVEYDNRFLSFAKDIGNREWEEEAYSNLGNAYHKLGEIEQAIHYYRLFLSITQEMSHREREGNAYLNLGGAFFVLRDFKQAAQYHRLYLNIVKELGDRCEEGRAYGCLSKDYHCLNDYKQAIEYGSLNLAISKEVGSKTDAAAAYHVLGNAFLHLGDFQKALSNYSLFLDAAKETGDLSSEGCAYGLIGLAYQNLGCFEKAIDYHQRHLCIATEMGDIFQQGCANGYIGCAYQSMGDSKQAIAFHENHLAIVKTEEESSGSEGYVYGHLGEAYLSLDDFERAIHYQTLRLTIAEEEGDKMEQGNAHYSLGCIYELLEILDEALLRFQSSVQQFQSVRALLQSRDEWKICFQDICQCANTALRRILLKQNKFGEALLVADEGRAQSLMDLMKLHYGIQAPFSESIPEKTVLDVPCSTLFLAIDDEENKINVWILLKNGDVYFRTTEIELDQETNLKDYLNSFYMHIFKEFDILAGVRCEDRSLDLLRLETVVNANSNLELPQDFHFDNSPLRDLYDIIVEPVVDLIQGEELIIVPDGSLYLTPFCALLDSDSRFLCESFRLRVIPSLSSLRLIVSCSEEYHSRKGALLVGDPCLRDVVVNGIILKQLPYARIEVEQIGEILMTEPLIGTNATKDEVLRRLNSVALVHIAAHGCSETGEIALSPNLTRESRIPESDDFLLTMADVLSVQMRARLVVLSCCHSGQGDVKAAEGVVGLARAFLASGARSVLVSLWAIDDEATLEFMKHFYQHLLVGRSSSESLDQAMKCLKESENYRSAKYWAPFVLIGDDVTFDFDVFH